MIVFLGWSGDRSKQTAEALGDWLGQTIQAVDPWISSDILKGARWEEEISDKLEEAKIGIICLAKENLDENWILFEAGALSKIKGAHVCTFLLGLKHTDIKQPLAAFQHTEFEKEDIRKLAHTINQAVEDAGERSLDKERLDRIFERFWPELEEKLGKIVEMPSKVGEPLRSESKPIRSDREILEEILDIVRKPEKREPEIFVRKLEKREPEIEQVMKPMIPIFNKMLLKNLDSSYDRLRLTNDLRLTEQDTEVINILKQDILDLRYRTKLKKDEIDSFDNYVELWNRVGDIGMAVDKILIKYKAEFHNV